MIRLLPYALALAVAGAIGFQGYRMGYASAEADQHAEELARIEAGRMLEADRRRIAQERDQLADQLKEQAHADPIIVERCLGPGRVLRLNALR
jgi:hypothetical protein